MGFVELCVLVGLRVVGCLVERTGFVSPRSAWLYHLWDVITSGMCLGPHLHFSQMPSRCLMLASTQLSFRTFILGLLPHFLGYLGDKFL